MGIPPFVVVEGRSTSGTMVLKFLILLVAVAAIERVTGSRSSVIKQQETQNLTQYDQHGRAVEEEICERNVACGVMGGTCVAKAKHCSGRLVTNGCKGKKCKCCIANTIESLMNISISGLDKKIDSLADDMDKSISNMNLNIGSMVDTFIGEISNLSAEIDSLIMLALCPDGCSNGQCTGPNECTCSDGYMGPTCDTQIPAGFELHQGRVIRRTLSSDPKSYFYDTAMSYCSYHNAQPFIPRNRDDYMLYKEVRESFGRYVHMWLPANDKDQEGTLRWQNGELATNALHLFPWRNGVELYNNDKWNDCVFYGTGPDALMASCTGYNLALPPICEII